MTMSFAPVASRMLRRVLGWRDLEESADRIVQISPAEEMPMAEAIYLPGQLERIRGTHSWENDLKHEIALTTEGQLSNLASSAYRIRHAVVGQGRVSTWTGYKDLSLRKAGGGPLWIEETLAEGALCSTWQGNDYFAHFLFDDAAIHPLGQPLGLPFFSGMAATRTRHCVDYLARFGFDYHEKRNIHVDALWLFRDFAFGPDKRRRLKAMAARVKAGTPQGRAAPGAFIRRGSTGQVRVLENAAEIEAWCLAQGFVIVDPEAQSVEEICAALRGVPLVIGVEGSQLVHALFSMAEGGAIICIQPPDRYNAVFRQLCAVFDLRWGFVVAEGTVAGFRQDLDALTATVDLVQGRIAAGGWA
ncbi:MAG: glycosyltransferase family 61 protein [Paracoccaceae bacterium]